MYIGKKWEKQNHIKHRLYKAFTIHVHYVPNFKIKLHLLTPIKNSEGEKQKMGQ